MSREYDRQYSTNRRLLNRRVCGCGRWMDGRSTLCRSCSKKQPRPGRTRSRPDKCGRCEIRYSEDIPRFEDSDHCLWCEEELQRGGRMVIGLGTRELGGWITVPSAVLDERTRKDEYNARYNAARRRNICGKLCACGKPINARSVRCAACAAKAFQERRTAEHAMAT